MLACDAGPDREATLFTVGSRGACNARAERPLDSGPRRGRWRRVARPRICRRCPVRPPWGLVFHSHRSAPTWAGSHSCQSSPSVRTFSNLPCTVDQTDHVATSFLVCLPHNHSRMAATVNKRHNVILAFARPQSIVQNPFMQHLPQLHSGPISVSALHP